MEAPKRQFFNTYLDAPIIEGEMLKCYVQTLALRGGEKLKNPAKTAHYLATQCDLSWNIECYSPSLLPVIIHTLPSQGITTGTSEAWRVARKVWNHADAGIRDLNPAILLPPTPETLPAQARSLYIKAELFVRFVERLATSRAAGSRKLVHETLGCMAIVGDQYSCALLYPAETTAYIMPYEAVLMFKDMLLARGNVLLGVSLVYGGDPGLMRIVEEVFQWEEECLYRYDNPGYEILSKIEAIVKAYVIHTEDPLLGDHEADVLARMREVVIKKENALRARDDYQVDRLITILSRSRNTAHTIELFGLQRMTGHPLIDPRVGGHSAAEEASRPIATSYLSARRLRNNWCRLYLEGFVRRSSQWPRLSFTAEGRTTQLYQLYKIRDRAIRRDSYPLSDWDHVRFGAHQEFDYYTNFTDLMDDKSISYYRDEFRATWDRSVKPRSQRRLLLEMLEREEISIRAIIEQVEARTVPLHWFIVSLYPKEREFKLAARMFSMMPFEMRAFFACLEANLADHVFPNLPQQTMTLSRTTIMERFFNLSKPLQSEGRERLFIEVDLSRWNLRWRDLPMRLIGMDLDDIFGSDGRYTFVHEFFRQCMIVVRVSGYPPEGLEQDPPPQTDLIWYNHEGGFEGIVQKDWTIATYAMVDLGMEPFDIEYSLLGQGDNQVILATVSVPLDVEDKKQYLRDLAARIKKSIAEACAAVGQEAKEEECLESTNVVTYSKDFYVGGSEYFLSLKAVSRIFPRGASDFPTVSNGISAITSSSIAAAERLKQPLYGYFLSLFHTARYLIRVRDRPTVEGSFLHKTFKRKLDEATLPLVLGIPGSLGGLPIAPLCSFVYKGGADPGSKDYLSLKILCKGGLTALGRVNRALLSGAWKPAQVDPQQLLEDPYSVPIRRSQTAENRILDLSLRQMLKITENRDIHELIDAPVEDYDTELKASLMAVTPFNPTLLSDLRSFSVVGAREMTMRMFTITRTVQSLMYKSEEDPGAAILTSSAGEVRALLAKITALPASRRAFGPVYTAAESLRSMWHTDQWKEKIVGVTSYLPLDWRIIVGEEAAEEEGVLLSYFPSENPWYVRGQEDPYLGTDTAEKRTKHGYKIVTSSAAEKAYERLALIATQPGITSSFVALVHEIAKTRSAIPLKSLLPYLSQAVGGSIAHRYQSSLGNRGASVLGCGTFASHISINSNYAGVLSASLLDYPIMFQEFFCAAIGLLNMVVAANPARPWYIRIVTPGSLKALPEKEVSAVYAPRTAPIFPRNPIAYCHDLSLLRITRPLETILSSPFAAADVASVSPARIAYQAAYRQLMNRHTAHLIADLGYGAIRLPLDLLEFRGLGLANVLHGVSVAISRFVIDAMFSRSHLDLRWNPLPVVTGLASSFGAHLVRAARHPIFADDPFAQEYLGSTSMAYNRAREVDTAVGAITSAVLMHLDQLTSLHTDLLELVFDDDQEEIPLLRAESIVKRIALRAVIRGELSAEDGYRLARRNLVQAVRMSETAGGKANGIYHLACVIADWATEQQKPGLAEEAGALAEGHLIKRVYRSQVQILRAMRGRISTAQATVRPTLAGSPVNILRPGIGTHTPVNTLCLQERRHYKEDRSFILFSLARRRIRKHGRHAPAVYSYWALSSLFARRNVVILGSGNGGAAHVAIAAGAATLVKHDLAKDIAIEDVARTTYTDGLTVVSRSSASIGATGGDLNDSKTWDALQQDLSGHRTIILDTPLEWSDLQHCFSRISSLSYGSVLAVRWVLSDTAACNVIATASRTQGYKGVVSVFCQAGYREFFTIHRVEWDGAWKPHTGDTQLPVWPLPDYTGISAMGGGLEWNNITFRGITQNESAKAAALSIQAMGRSKHTFTHTQWTATLRMLLAQQIDASPTWMEDVASLILNRDFALVLVGDTTLPFALTPPVKRWLLVSYPRTRA